MAVLSNTSVRAGAAAAGGDSGYKIEKSLRFNNDDSAKLSRTFTSAGDRRRFTLSFWAKNCDADATNDKIPFCSDNGGYTQLEFYAGYLSTQVYAANGTDWWVSANTSSTHRFRDPSAWYHIVLSIDTEAGTTNADRQKIYINGEQLTLTFSTAWGGLMTGDVKGWGDAAEHFIGMRGSSYGGNWLAAEYYFIDGQALDASSFGETDEDTGKWVAKEYAGTYGPKVDQSQTWSGSVTNPSGAYGVAANAFDGDSDTHASPNYANPMTYTNASPSDTVIQTFEVKCACYSTGWVVELNDTAITSQLTTTDQWHTITGFTGEQFEKLYWRPSVENYEVRIKAIRINGKILVDDTVTVNDNSFYLKFNGTDLGEDSSGNDNDWTATNLTQSVLSFTSDDFATSSHFDNVKAGTDGSQTLVSLLNSSGVPQATRNQWFSYNTNNSPNHHIEITFDPPITTTSEFSIYGGDYNNGVYDWTATVTYSDDTTDSENGQSGNSDWWDRSSFSTGGKSVKKAKIASESSFVNIMGFTKENSNTIILPSAGTALDIDVSTDTPTDFDDGGNGTGNYCTMNPLDKEDTSLALTNGNLQVNRASGSAWKIIRSSQRMDSGAWYWEVQVLDAHQNSAIGVCTFDSISIFTGGTYQDYISYGSLTTGDIWGVAYDADNGTLDYYKNGAIQSSEGETGVPQVGLFAAASIYGPYSSSTNPGFIFNFGQRAFTYTPPTGYKALNTYNLPDPVITDPSKYFDTKLYTGTGASHDITGLNFSPDLVWIKKYTTASHAVFDTIRGATYRLRTDGVTAVDWDNTTLSAFGTEGFTLSTNHDVNQNTDSYVAWNWDAGSSNTSVSAGGLNSTVYDQSKTWSDESHSSTGSVWSAPPSSDSLAAANLFDGSLTTYVGPYSGGTLTVSFGQTFSGTKTYNVYWYAWDTGESIKDQDGNTLYTPASGDVGLYQNKWHEFQGTDVSSLKFTSTTSANASGVYSIKVDGKELIDDDVTVTNVPSIATTYRANTTAGFSIVSYVGNATSGASIAHGLNTKPDFAIFKAHESAGYAWYVYHKDLPNTHHLYLNYNSAQNDDIGAWNDTDPDSNVMTLGNAGNVADNNGDMIAYMWSEVENYSKFGKFDGSGTTDGPFIWCGFRPAWVMFKRTDSSHGWNIYDSKRDPYNEADVSFLYADATASNTDGDEGAFDMLSNGFKMKGNWNINNASGGTYIFAAFADSSFKYANAR